MDPESDDQSTPEETNSDRDDSSDDVDGGNSHQESGRQEVSFQTRVWRRISSENPFYLLSAALVIHSTGLSIVSASELDLNFLLSLIFGYLLLVSGLAIFLVRNWKVWDDARSLFLIPILLMFELSLVFDRPLTSGESHGFVGLLAVVFACIVLSEFVIRLSQVRLPMIYRGPFYLQLSLLLSSAFLPYVVGENFAPEMVRWAIFGVSVLAGLSMFTLIPAVRSGRERVENSGCPWIWPYHPWSLFVVVWVCFGLRIYLLSISFDPAWELNASQAYENRQTMFTGLMLVPMLLGICWLAMEAAIAHKSRFSKFLAYTLPFACILLSSFPQQLNPAAASFVRDFSSRFGSPIIVACIASMFFSLIYWARGLRFGRRCTVFSLLMLAWITSESQISTLSTEISAVPFVLACCILTFEGIRLRTSRLVIEACCWGILALGETSVLTGWPLPEIEIQVHLVLLSILLTGLMIRDELIYALFGFVMFLFTFAAVRMALCSFFGVYDILFASLYLAGLLTCMILVELIVRSRELRVVTLIVGACFYLSIFWEGGRYLQQNLDWNGVQPFMLGLVMLQLGVVVSAYKSGNLAKLFGGENELDQSREVV
ncbi:hypothetical protein KOR42_50950 [Thalassoglobus neptunius]|uniref:Uncharacterized protein n=1 Tax=Thalassoglobus neptunius TaxID=1938619 RepID=A0A5C5VP35_9PLAN|nr:hypothetical protein [Thalassoglobus neptunius]TWT39860.1 hypothetical protein KOR42_50950 [Thalassoglobus neptunius]